MTISSREEAVKKIAELVANSRSSLDEAIAIANEWEIEVNYSIYQEGERSIENYTDWNQSDEWYDSGCSYDDADWQSSDC